MAETLAEMTEATRGFDFLFANQLAEARAVFGENEHPFHLMGRGVCAFLQAALGMEEEYVPEAVKSLSAADAGAKKKAKVTKAGPQTGRFPAGLEWEVVSADTTILNGVTNVLSETYMGYLQCLYALNSAHSKFSKLFKTVFPNGLPDGAEPRVASRKPSSVSLAPSTASAAPSAAPATPSGSLLRPGFFSRFSSRPSSPAPVPAGPDGPIEDLILSGTAFGYGVFNLVFSLLPARARSVVGFFGFTHDRKLALRALAFSAGRDDVHAAFAGLGLMTYLGVILLLAGWQADERALIEQYKGIVDRLLKKYPTGSLWILNRAKIERMQGQADTAIATLQAGLAADRAHDFVQADALLVFELAWTLLGQRRYGEAADAFLRMTEINSWSHSTYLFIAAGCHLSLGHFEKAQELLEAAPAAADKKKASGKDLPTEVFIKKKIAMYKRKQVTLTGSEEGWIHCIKINPAEEMAIFWNTHARIPKEVAEAHIGEWMALTPTPTIASPYTPAEPAAPAGAPDLTTPDELAVRALLLGVAHRSVGEAGAARAFLEDALAAQPHLAVNTWVGGVAQFELAVLDLREAAGGDTAAWAQALRGAGERLDKALALAGSAVDLSSRLDMRIAMLRDEITAKREALGIPMA